MKKYLYIIIILLFSFEVHGAKLQNNSAFELIVSDNTLEISNKKLDINKVSKKDIVNQKFSLKIAGAIIDYREKTGGFLELEELKRIKGIGEATYKKLADKFEIDKKKNVIKKSLYINKADDELLKYYGFTKKEIEKINKFKKENKIIKNNLDLRKILTENRYDEYKKIVKYEVK